MALIPQRARAQALWQALGARLEDAPSYPPGYMRAFLAREAPYFVWWLSFRLPPPPDSRAHTLAVLAAVDSPNWSDGLGSTYSSGDPQAMGWLHMAYRRAQSEDEMIAKLRALTIPQLEHRLRVREAMDDRSLSCRLTVARLKGALGQKKGTSVPWLQRVRDLRADPHLRAALQAGQDVPALARCSAATALGLWGEVADALAAGQDGPRSGVARQALLADALKLDALGAARAAAEARARAARLDQPAARLWEEALALPASIQALVDEAEGESLANLPPLWRSILRTATQAARAGRPEELQAELPKQRARSAQVAAAEIEAVRAIKKAQQDADAHTLKILRSYDARKLAGQLRSAQRELQGNPGWRMKTDAEKRVAQIKQVQAERAAAPPAAGAGSAPGRTLNTVERSGSAG